MVTLEDAVIARLDIKGEHFELLVDPELAWKIREGEPMDLRVLAVEQVFRDAGKGERASDQSLEEAFGTSEMKVIAQQIITQGNLQLTTERRKALQEQKRKAIIAELARTSINPQTHTPHPPLRIQLAMEGAKVHVDPFKPVDLQVREVLEALRPVLPIRIERLKAVVQIPATHVGKGYAVLRSFPEVGIQREEWRPDGSWLGVVQLPAGVKEELCNRLNDATAGQVEVKVVGD